MRSRAFIQTIWVVLLGTLWACGKPIESSTDTLGKSGEKVVMACSVKEFRSCLSSEKLKHKNHLTTSSLNLCVANECGLGRKHKSDPLNGACNMTAIRDCVNHGGGAWCVQSDSSAPLKQHCFVGAADTQVAAAYSGLSKSQRIVAQSAACAIGLREGATEIKAELFKAFEGTPQALRQLAFLAGKTYLETLKLYGDLFLSVGSEQARARLKARGTAVIDKVNDINAALHNTKAVAQALYSYTSTKWALYNTLSESDQETFVCSAMIHLGAAVTVGRVGKGLATFEKLAPELKHGVGSSNSHNIEVIHQALDKATQSVPSLRNHRNDLTGVLIASRHYHFKTIALSASNEAKLKPVQIVLEKDLPSYEVFIHHGLVYSKSGQLLDSTNSLYKDTFGEKWAIFVMREDGRIFVAEEYDPQIFTHISLTRGNPVASAGLIKVSKGKIERVSNAVTGGYTGQSRPQFTQILSRVKDDGAHVEDIRVDHVAPVH